ncbi:MAG TPA: site-specific integrase [Solirubrobacteraceae bacterium]
MDDWGLQPLRPWIGRRLELPVGPLLCVASGSTAGRPWAPHQLRHAYAVEMAREGVSLNVIQRQLGHANLGITSVYLEGIDNAEIIDAVHARRPPMLPATAGLRCSFRSLSAVHDTRRSDPQLIARAQIEYLPAVKLRLRWRFLRHDVEEWVRARKRHAA